MTNRTVFPGRITLIERLTYIIVVGALTITAANANADHFNDPNDGKYDLTPAQCFRDTGERALIAISKRKAKKLGLRATKPCDRHWWGNMWYENVDGVMVFNNQYCTGMGRGVGGFKPECWLTTENSDRSQYEVAGDAIAC